MIYLNFSLLNVLFLSIVLKLKINFRQFSGQDETISFPVKGTEVTIIGSSGDHQVGSSKLHMKNIVNYVWDHKYVIIILTRLLYN